MGRNHPRTEHRRQHLGLAAPRTCHPPVVEHAAFLCALNRSWRRTHLYSCVVALLLLQHALRIAAPARDCLWIRIAHLLWLGADRPKTEPASAMERGVDVGSGLLFHSMAGCSRLPAGNAGKWRCEDAQRDKAGGHDEGNHT